MLDTVILQLEQGKFTIIDYGKFGTTKELMLNCKSPFFKWVNNPTALDKSRNIYKPRLTAIKRGRRYVLKIEFSAPKLILGNNVEELEDADFELVTKTLRKRMQDMGVMSWTKHIEEADVLSFHPSKNIQLKSGYTANLAIKELNKLDLSKRFDLDEKNYRNNGEVLQFYTRSHAFVIYDKMNDLVKPGKRAVDKEQTSGQLSIFNYIKEHNSRFELLRLEVRLTAKRKMNEIMDKIGYSTNPKFKDIFKKEICKKIMLLYWLNFYTDNMFILSTKSNPLEILQLILMKYPRMKIIKIIQLTGLYLLCRDEAGMKGFRQIISSYKPKTNWQVVKRDITFLQDEIFSKSLWGFVSDIKEQLNTFVSIKLQADQDKNI